MDPEKLKNVKGMPPCDLDDLCKPGSVVDKFDIEWLESYFGNASVVRERLELLYKRAGILENVLSIYNSKEAHRL